DRLLVAIALAALGIRRDALALDRVAHAQRRDERRDQQRESRGQQQQRRPHEHAGGGGRRGGGGNVARIQGDGARRGLRRRQRGRGGHGAAHAGAQVRVDGVERLQAL